VFFLFSLAHTNATKRDHSSRAPAAPPGSGVCWDFTPLPMCRASLPPGVPGVTRWQRLIQLGVRQVQYHYGEPVDPTEYQNEYIGQVLCCWAELF